MPLISGQRGKLWVAGFGLTLVGIAMLFPKAVGHFLAIDSALVEISATLGLALILTGC